MFQKIITTLLLLAITVIVTVLIATVIRTKRNNPKYSYIMAIINTVLIPLELLQLGPFKHGKKIEFSVAMTEAIAKTDLNDYGNLNFIYNYGKIAELSLYKSLKFTNLGFFMAYKELQMVLMRRLQLVNYQKNYPSINQVPIRSPVFVMGLGRSGTTFVHRLLSLDPLVRSPLLWELVLPVPTINNNNNNYDDQINNNNSYSDNKTDDNSTINSNKIFYNKNTKKLFEEDRMKRAEFVKNRIKERKSFGDSILESLHEIGHDLPEECLMALSNDIPLAFHYVYTFLINITDLEQLLPSNEIVQAYQNYKFVLQLLSYQIGEGNNPRRWVLKCPLHTIFIPEILKVFPDAKFVW